MSGAASTVDRSYLFPLSFNWLTLLHSLHCHALQHYMHLSCINPGCNIRNLCHLYFYCMVEVEYGSEKWARFNAPAEQSEGTYLIEHLNLTL